MTFRGCIVLFIALQPSSAAFADDFVVGPKGAMYCGSEADLEKMLMSSSAGSKDVVRGCGVLPQGTIVAGAQINTKGGVSLGSGVALGHPVAFLAVDGSMAALSGSESAGASVAGKSSIRDELTNPVDVRRVSPEDLRVETHKWDGKVIETKVNCFYADVNEFRCVANNLRVDFSEVIPNQAQAFLEKECDTIQKASRKACSVFVRFKYSSYERKDSNNIYGATTLIGAVDDLGFVKR